MFIGLLCLMLLMNHPSPMCLTLVLISIMIVFMLKSLIISISAYLFLIIFIGGILLMLFYLTMISSNKPSWQISMLVLPIILVPDFNTIKNLKFSTLDFSLKMLEEKSFMFMMIMLLLGMMFIINIFLNKISFMRQLK
uniref:NADH dehydrogenase subunit 6 n=1 Tax=Hexamermis agrotis TaxID=387665 RepID=A2TN47_9BILA|nr:NADH dehydrogenase subunit 6 [Hexamermis agrotis]ABM79864.1 NADH dehydrogenase subunit 6 [Hexamermis agrotis]